MTDFRTFVPVTLPNPGPCHFIATAVQTAPFGQAVPHTQCAAHGWTFAPGEVISHPLCPLGRIEVATQAAIAQIQAAVPKP